MSRYEFQVVPAPTRARKLTDLTKGQDVYCATITDILTDMGLAGWEFVGAETLPHYQRRMFFFSSYSEMTCLVFRREIERLIEPSNRLQGEVFTPRRIAPQPSEMVAQKEAQKSTGARRLNVSMPKEEAARIPRRTKPLRLEDPVSDDDTVIPIKLHRVKESRSALSALERAVSLQPEH